MNLLPSKREIYVCFCCMVLFDDLFLRNYVALFRELFWIPISFLKYQSIMHSKYALNLDWLSSLILILFRSSTSQDYSIILLISFDCRNCWKKLFFNTELTTEYFKYFVKTYILLQPQISFQSYIQSPF